MLSSQCGLDEGSEKQTTNSWQPKAGRQQRGREKSCQGMLRSHLTLVMLLPFFFSHQSAVCSLDIFLINKRWEETVRMKTLDVT